MLVGYMRVSTDGDRQVLVLNCAAEPAASSTKASHATAWRVRSSSIAWAKSATAPTRTRSIEPPV